MAELVKKGTLEDLPVFDRVPKADRDNDHPLIFEMARITRYTTPPFTSTIQKTASGGVIGRDQGLTVVYMAPTTMEMGGKIHAYPEGIISIDISNIEYYIIPEENAFRQL